MIKRATLFYFFFFSFVACQLCSAESGYTLYERALQNEKKAAEELRIHPQDKAAQLSSADIFSKAANDYLLSGNRLKGLKMRSAYCAAVCFEKAASLLRLQNKSESAYALVGQAITLWPELNAINAELVMKEIELQEAGITYRLPAIASEQQFIFQYYALHTLCAQLSFDLNKTEESMNLALEVATYASGNLSLQLRALYFLSQLKASVPCQAAEFSVKGIRLAEITAPFEADSAEVFASYLNGFTIILDSASTCLSRDELKDVGLTLTKMPQQEMKQSGLRFGQQAYARGCKSADLLFEMCRTATLLGRTDDQIVWLHRIEEAKHNFSKEAWADLADLYHSLSKEEPEKEARRNSQRGLILGNTSLGIAINPISPFQNIYSFSVDMIRPRWAQEVRVNVASNAKHYFPTEGIKAQSLRYRGTEIAYTFKIRQKGDNLSKSYYGPQFSYEHRDYNPVEVNLSSNTGKAGTTQVVTGASNRYEATLMIGKQWMWKLIYTDIHVGTGIGYKTLETSGYDKDNYSIDDFRYRKGVWDKAYIPFHLGFRIGIYI